jgi:hypothetical protein
MLNFVDLPTSSRQPVFKHEVAKKLIKEMKNLKPVTKITTKPSDAIQEERPPTTQTLAALPEK